MSLLMRSIGTRAGGPLYFEGGARKVRGPSPSQTCVKHQPWAMQNAILTVNKSIIGSSRFERDYVLHGFVEVGGNRLCHVSSIRWTHRPSSSPVFTQPTTSVPTFVSLIASLLCCWLLRQCLTSHLDRLFSYRYGLPNAHGLPEAFTPPPYHLRIRPLCGS